MSAHTMNKCTCISGIKQIKNLSQIIVKWRDVWFTSRPEGLEAVESRFSVLYICSRVAKSLKSPTCSHLDLRVSRDWDGGTVKTSNSKSFFELHEGMWKGQHCRSTNTYVYVNDMSGGRQRVLAVLAPESIRHYIYNVNDSPVVFEFDATTSIRVSSPVPSNWRHVSGKWADVPEDDLLAQPTHPISYSAH